MNIDKASELRSLRDIMLGVGLGIMIMINLTGVSFLEHDESVPPTCDSQIMETYGSPLDAKEAQEKGLIECQPSQMVQQIMDYEK